MSHFYQDIHYERIREVHRRLEKELVLDWDPLKAVCAVTPEPVPYAERESLEYRPVSEGDVWGHEWDCGWFRVSGKVPESWKGSYVTLWLDIGGEGQIFDADGCPKTAISSGTVFDTHFIRTRVHWIKECEGGEKVDFWMEGGANCLFGASIPADPSHSEGGLKLNGSWTADVRKLRVCRFDYDKWQLWLDLDVIMNLIEALPSGTARRVQVLRIASGALDMLPAGRGGVNSVREALRPIFELGADPATVDVNAIGHAHIDTAWLWPLRETKRKVGRTFSNQLYLMERYPEFKFGESQPQLYDFCRRNYPKLYEKVKKAVAEGRWELQGGMWVEADCNIPNGESLLRQMIHGLNFFKDEFGVEVKNVWLPDVFGYSGNLPQLMRLCGISYFLTQKLSWNRYNRFPHNSFIWRGIDGSEVVAHFPPEDDYNSRIYPAALRKHETNNSEAGLVKDAISLFGFGDGGGGPIEEMIERGRRCTNLNGCPRFHFAFAQPALERIGECRADLDIWDGELYFEMHRGTFTSQAAIKLWNRRTEEALRSAEMLCAAAGLEKYPAAKFDELWKRFLVNHFHDIIPGSSINRVYSEAVPELKAVVEECRGLGMNAARSIMKENSGAMTLFNPSSTEFRGVIELPEGWKGAVCGDGCVSACQREAESYFAAVSVPACGFVTLRSSDTEAEGAAVSGCSDENVLENGKVRYVIDSSMRLVSAVDKASGIEFIQPGEAGNAIRLFDDHPREYDAWDFEEFASRMETARPAVISMERIDGPARSGIMAMMRLGENTVIQQTAWLEKDGERLDFVTNVDWKESHKLCRVEFPVTPRAQEARYEIQYGTVARPTNNNTKWQFAQFECVGHRYVDLSEPDFGVTLLTDCKYGYRVKDGVMSISLLRSPTHPDPVCDRGANVFTYSFLPHTGSLAAESGKILANAAELNQGVTRLEGLEADASVRLPVAFEGSGVEMSVLKRAERENCLVVRLAETSGRCASGRLVSNAGAAAFAECDAVEWNELGEAVASPAEIKFKPFQIRTFKVRMR